MHNMYRFTKFYRSDRGGNPYWDGCLSNDMAWLNLRVGRSAIDRSYHATWSYTDRCTPEGLYRTFCFSESDDYAMFALVCG